MNNSLVALILDNCSELADAFENLPDDEYSIQLSSSCDAVSMFCHNMSSIDPLTRAVEYLTLPAGANENYGMYYRPRLQNYGSCSGPEVSNPPETAAFWGQSWLVLQNFYKVSTIKEYLAYNGILIFYIQLVLSYVVV